MTKTNEITANVRSILDEAERFDGTSPVSDQALIAAARGDRTLIDFGDAVGIVGHGELDLVVRPDARGRGIGRAALQSLLEVHHTEGALRAWAHGENPAAVRLLNAAGFVSVRVLLRMTLDASLLPGAVASARPLPDGFAVRAFESTKQRDADEWVRVNAAAFASHPEQGKMTRADFDALTAEPWFDAQDLRLAFKGQGGDRDTLAAFSWVKTVRDESGTETELYAIGVDPPFAGHGLGAAMLGETFRRMSDHEPNRISLYVDADNTQALSLYERAGFRVEQRSEQYLLTE